MSEHTCTRSEPSSPPTYANAKRFQAVRSILRKALSAPVAAMVETLQKLACLYSAQGVRHDGHYKLNKRIVGRLMRFPSGKGARQRPYNAILAFTGVDGALLAVPEATDGEGWRTLEPILEALLWKIKATRLEAGLSLLQSCPTFHCTDNFRAQRLKLEALYKRLWRDCAVGSQGNTKKGPAKRRRVQDPGALTVVAGDPVHDLLALRRRVSTMACDSTDLTFDHADLLSRLSAPEQRPLAAV